MAAQYYDEKIPAKHNADLSIDLGNGRHECQIRQLFDPTDNNHQPEGKVHFEIVVQTDTSKKSQSIDKIFWQTQ